MTQITNTKKIVAGLMSLAMVFGAVVVPVSKADAQTTTTTTTTSTSATYTRDLTVGSRGADVTSLQAWLAAGGFLMVAPTGYYGPLTKAALASYQASVGITPAVGYFGPITRAYIATSGSVSVGTLPAGCSAGSMYSTTTGMPCTTTSAVPGCMAGAKFSSTTGQPCTGGTTTTTTTTTTLSGTDGNISDVNKLTQYNNEKVGEGQKDVKVLGFEVEASNDGDIGLKSLKLSFDPTGNATGDSDDLDDYIKSVKVWQGSTEIGSANVSDFSEDNNDLWTRTITLSNSVVRADKTEKFYVSVDAVRTFDSGDIDSDSWTVDVENIRFVDGSGVTTTETGYDLGGMDVAIDFVPFSQAANTKLKITKDSSSPKAGIVVIDESNNTDDVVLLKGKIEIEGTSDVTIDEFPVTLTTVGGASVTAVTGNLTLKIGNEEYSESVSISSALTGTVTFDNLDFDIDAGDTVEFTVMADINDIDAGTLDEGDTLLASVTATNRDYIDVEDEAGDQLELTSTFRTGTATGEALEFRTNGIKLTLEGTPSTSVAAGNGPDDDTGTFTIRFKVMAIGDTVYVSSLADAQLSGNTDGKTTVLVDRAGTAIVGGVSTVLTNITDTTKNAAGLYEIQEGQSETFELTTSVQLPAAGTSGLYRAVLGGVRWTTDATDATPSNSYTSNLDSFKTSYISLN
ncbi:peptidoglycan-binding protein [Patescibacteria group bacterium]|nr:peptidoglycan-binding protein [Patescibacteria group bacterium]